MTSNPQRILVIGGGITGLAAAYRLTELDPHRQIVLVEASDRLGGVLETVRRDGYLIERSADNFITNVPWAVELSKRVGLGDQLLATDERLRAALVVRNGRLVRVPAGFSLMAPGRAWPIVTTPLLSSAGKLRVLAERFVRGGAPSADESLAAFARRRLGVEAFERIVQPLVGGIYTADPEKLSLAATLPRFQEMERRWGSLTRGIREENAQVASESGFSGAVNGNDAGARYSQFVAPREGLSSLVAAVAARLPAGCVRLRSPVREIRRREQGWTIVPTAGEPLDCDAVIVTAPAPAAAKLLAGLDEKLSLALAEIEYASTAVVSLAFARNQIRKPLDGFGFVVPAIERRPILAASFASLKFPGRAPADHVLVRVFIGGACQSELLDGDDPAILEIAVEQLRMLIGAEGSPAFSDVARWPHSMPQYHIGHLERVATIERAVSAWPGLALAGNAYRGVGIPHCVHSGNQAAEKIHALLASGVHG
ncbi:MAG TPA: protoporphyrinogen oxidase [Pirellulales bacterium]|nr:protoporphyrinogen oxidase [Pirellulales bacterium]